MALFIKDDEGNVIGRVETEDEHYSHLGGGTSRFGDWMSAIFMTCILGFLGWGVGTLLLWSNIIMCAANKAPEPFSGVTNFDQAATWAFYGTLPAVCIIFGGVIHEGTKCLAGKGTTFKVFGSPIDGLDRTGFVAIFVWAATIIIMGFFCRL